MTSQGLAWLEQKVPEFAQLPDKDKSEIQDFSLLWSFFEGNILNGQANVSSIRTYVESLATNGAIDSIDFNEYLAYLRDRYFKNGSYTENYQYLYMERSGNPPEVDQMLREPSNTKTVLLIGCLVVVFRLRNNLFHGDKWKYQLQGQYTNFKQANLLLIKLMNLNST